MAIPTCFQFNAHSSTLFVVFLVLGSELVNEPGFFHEESRLPRRLRLRHYFYSFELRLSIGQGTTKFSSRDLILAQVGNPGWLEVVKRRPLGESKSAKWNYAVTLVSQMRITFKPLIVSKFAPHQVEKYKLVLNVLRQS